MAKPAKEIIINDVLKALGGVIFNNEFCGLHKGAVKFCTNSVDCSARSLWQMIQYTMDQLLEKVTLHDLVNSEKGSTEILHHIIENNRSLSTQNIPG